MENSQVKQKRSYKKRKVEQSADPAAAGESKSFAKKREYYLRRSEDYRPGQPQTLFGQPIDGQWTLNSNGWVRSQHSQVEKLPRQQMIRYFKITKTLEEVDPSELDPGVPTDKDGNLPRTQEEWNQLLKERLERTVNV